MWLLAHLWSSFDLSREIVAVSLDLFDRYLATCGNKCSGNLALLTSLTTLHIAIKLHESKKVKINTLANLSRGQFGPEHIEEMEWKILSALQWKLHPATQYAFVSYLLLLLPQEVNVAVRKELFELSRYLTELAVCDSYFVSVDNSTVALAAILNVLEEVPYSRLSAGTRERFWKDVTVRVGLDPRAPLVRESRDRIKTMFNATSGHETVAVVRTNECDNNSMASVSSVGSSGSAYGRFNRPRSGSVDTTGSKGSCRYSPSPHRRFLTNVSPMSRAHTSSSPMVASVQ